MSFRDVNGNLLPTPAWPPPDSAYDHNTLTIWFNRSVINHDFLCWYWNSYYHPGDPIIQYKDDKNEKEEVDPVEYPVGCFPLTRNLFSNQLVYDALNMIGVKELCQYTMLDPCEDTLMLTHYGTTIPAPEFWNSYYVILDSNIALEALEWLIMQFGGTLIDFAELNTFMYPDNDLPNNPNDSGWVDGYQTAFLDTIFGENITGAWKYEHGNRNIKVAVIDKGIRYSLPEFGGTYGYPELSLGCDSCRIVNGREFNISDTTQEKLFNWDVSDGSSQHATSVAALIGARTNNNIGIASIAGGWSVTDGVGLFSMYMNLLKKSIINLVNRFGQMLLHFLLLLILIFMNVMYLKTIQHANALEKDSEFTS